MNIIRFQKIISRVLFLWGIMVFGIFQMAFAQEKPKDILEPVANDPNLIQGQKKENGKNQISEKETSTMKIYVCKICGHLVFNELLEKCPVCGAEKKDFEQKDKIFEESKAKSPEAEVKHVPAVSVNKSCGLIPEKSCTDVIVRVGKTLHPMEEKHYIQFIDCYQNDRFLGRVEFTPGLEPAACFHLKEPKGKITITEHCNLHGYWKVDCDL